MKFHLVIKIKIPTAELSMKKFQNFVSILRFKSKTNFMLSRVEHGKSFITSGPVLACLEIIESHTIRVFYQDLSLQAFCNVKMAEHCIN